MSDIKELGGLKIKIEVEIEDVTAFEQSVHSAIIDEIKSQLQWQFRDAINQNIKSNLPDLMMKAGLK